MKTETDEGMTPYLSKVTMTSTRTMNPQMKETGKMSLRKMIHVMSDQNLRTSKTQNNSNALRNMEIDSLSPFLSKSIRDKSPTRNLSPLKPFHSRFKTQVEKTDFQSQENFENHFQIRSEFSPFLNSPLVPVKARPREKRNHEAEEEIKSEMFDGTKTRSTSLFKAKPKSLNFIAFPPSSPNKNLENDSYGKSSSSFLKKSESTLKIIGDKLAKDVSFFSQYRLPPQKLQLLKKSEKAGQKISLITAFPQTQNEEPETRFSGYLKQIEKSGLMPLPLPNLITNFSLFMIDFRFRREEYGVAIGKFIKNNGGGVRHIYICKNQSNDKGLGNLLESGFLEAKNRLEGSEIVTFKYEENQIGPVVINSIKNMCSQRFFSELIDLSISGCVFSNASLQTQIFQSFAGSSREIRSLNISNTCLSSASFEVFLQYIESISANLEFLNISNISITSHNMVKALQFMEEHLRSLQQLILSSNSMAEDAFKCMECLLDLLSVNTKMIHLDISNCSLQLSDCRGLLELLSHDLDQEVEGEPFSFLCSLHLTGNFLNEEEIEEAVDILNKKLPPNALEAFRHHLHPEELKNPPSQLFAHEITTICNETMTRIQWPYFSHDLQESLYRNRKGKVKARIGHSLAETGFAKKESKGMSKLIFFRMLDPDLVTGPFWYFSNNCFICERWAKKKFKTSFYFESEVSTTQRSSTNRRIGKNNIHHNVLVPERFEGTSKKTSPEDVFLLGRDEADGGQMSLGLDLFLAFDFLKDWTIWYQFNSLTNKHDFSFYFPPGEHHYCIGIASKDKNKFSILYDGLVELGMHEKNYEVNPSRGGNRRKKEKKFSIEQSVFKGAIIETAHVTKQTMDFDTNNSKIHKLIPSATERDQLKEVLEKYYKTIKGYYNYYAINSKYPCINMAGFDRFVQDAKLLDKKLTLTLVHQTFLTVNYQIEGNTESMDSKIYRYEFTELLIRLASIKYFSTGKTKSHSEAFELMMEQDVLPNIVNHSDNVSDFREKHMYNLEVNDMLERNVEGLTKVFRKFRNLDGLMPFDEIRKLTLEVLGLKISEREILRYFAASKQVIMNEVTQFKSYTGLSFVEFLEWICRMSEPFVQENSEMEKLPVYEKIGKVIDALLKIMKMKRVPLDKKT